MNNKPTNTKTQFPLQLHGRRETQRDPSQCQHPTAAEQSPGGGGGDGHTQLRAPRPHCAAQAGSPCIISFVSIPYSISYFFFFFFLSSFSRGLRNKNVLLWEAGRPPALPEPCPAPPCATHRCPARLVALFPPSPAAGLFHSSHLTQLPHHLLAQGVKLSAVLLLLTKHRGLAGRAAERRRAPGERGVQQRALQQLSAAESRPTSRRYGQKRGREVTAEDEHQ